MVWDTLHATAMATSSLVSVEKVETSSQTAEDQHKAEEEAGLPQAKGVVIEMPREHQTIVTCLVTEI